MTPLRVIACGAVDDGKSTLIGRLLYDADRIDDDRLAMLKADSARRAGRDATPDFSLLLDGLAAEREQGITIDVAHRRFATARRAFALADAPGHPQYTRNMATAASTADAAILVIDASKGLRTQTRRHSALITMFGVEQLALVVNKMDLIGYDKARFGEIVADYLASAEKTGACPARIAAIPVCARIGANVGARGAGTPWYEGPTLLDWLERATPATGAATAPFRMPVQLVSRPDAGFRGYAGLVVGGSVKPGDPVVVAPSGHETRIARIVTRDGDLKAASVGRSVTVTLADDIDVSRGDVLCAAATPAPAADHLRARILWTGDAPMLPGRSYLIKIGTRIARATPGKPRHAIDIEGPERSPRDTLALNEIGVVDLALDREIAFDPYRLNRDMGGLILIDRLSDATVGMGTIECALLRSATPPASAADVTREARAGLKGHRPAALWFTGLSGSGKSTIANALEARLHAMGLHTALLDGDNVRRGLNSDLGFSDADRVENIRRIAEVARLMTDAGLIALVAFISPFRAERRMARGLMAQGEFIEIFVDTPLAIAEKRDPKGLYARARRGEIPNFTGLDSPYEPPGTPDIRIDTTACNADEAAGAIIAALRRRGILQ